MGVLGQVLIAGLEPENPICLLMVAIVQITDFFFQFQVITKFSNEWFSNKPGYKLWKRDYVWPVLIFKKAVNV